MREPLPNRPRLRPGLAVLHRRPGEFQVGTAPGRATVVRGVPAAVLDAAEQLRGGRTAEEMISVAGRHGPELDEVLRGLAEQGLVEDASRAGPGYPPRFAAESTLAAQRGTADLDRRARASVVVHGGGRVAVALAGLLAAAGVRRVRVAGGGVVAPEDLGTGLRLADIGADRAAAGNAAVLRAEETAVTTARRADLVVLADAVVPDPVVVGALRGPHLPVVAQDGVVAVGPLVVPGWTPCLTCVDHHKADLDGCWPVVAAQLAGKPRPADVATSWSAAALAAAHVHEVLGRTDPLDSPLVGAVLELDPLVGSLTRRRWPLHPRCGCEAVRRERERRGGVRAAPGAPGSFGG
ncbi:hypothetical protein [Actinokineospora bangkokensis]|uniref:Thiamine biosynthesis protein ThiF n=1 Tax=Actinokineospora bangkokensis TaxID=1193682 RepID=A0A1Q9LDX1_9PSEU|nr:hypothetical protein [Actinokineospora bangkokensis]OLR90230.1 hypothetical protein BJP25_04550 [Actinokineospora bangkokensis]